MIDFEFLINYDSGFTLKVALQHTGGILGLIGDSGSGKTSLLQALAGLLKPAEGHIRVNSNTWFDAENNIHIAPRKRRVGFVFQDNRLFPHMNVEQNLYFGHKRLPQKARLSEPDRIIQLLRLAPLLDRHCSTLSGGEQKRVAIGRALLWAPEVLLLDEPLTGLDPTQRQILLGYLLKLRTQKDLHILYVTHTLSDLILLADRAACIREGEVQLVENPFNAFDALTDSNLDDPIETLIEATPLPLPADTGYTWVQVGRYRWLVPQPSSETPGEILISIRADETLLAKGSLPKTTARNQITGTIKNIQAMRNRQIVTVDVGTDLLIEITPSALEDLRLQTGQTVTVLFKARSVRTTTN